MKNKTPQKLNALAKGIHMGEEIFEHYSEMAKNVQLRDSLIEIQDNYEEYCIELGKDLNVSNADSEVDNNYLNVFADIFKKLSDTTSTDDQQLKDNTLSALESAMEISREFLETNVVNSETSYNIIENFIDDNRILFNQVEAIELDK